jgi:hypothetical protein
MTFVERVERTLTGADLRCHGLEARRRIDRLREARGPAVVLQDLESIGAEHAADLLGRAFGRRGQLGRGPNR